MEGMGDYFIRPGAIEQVLVITNTNMNLDYNYAKLSLENPPDIFCKLTHTIRIITWITSKFAWNPALRERD